MMNNLRRRILYNLIVTFILLMTLSECKKKGNTQKKPEDGEKETNLFNFLRLIVFRMIYGFATMFGGQEGISEFMGGIFVPPGADDAEYRDYFEGDDDDDFDY